MSVKKMLRALTLGAIFLLIPLGLPAADISGWRPPEQNELAESMGWRQDDSARFLRAAADYDGDGIVDVASLLVNDAEKQMGLFVSFGGDKRPDAMALELMEKSWIDVMGVGVAAPGTYATACGKGYFDCREGEEASLKLDRPAIDFFKFGSANSFFVWQDSNGKFRRVWISD